MEVARGKLQEGGIWSKTKRRRGNRFADEIRIPLTKFPLQSLNVVICAFESCSRIAKIFVVEFTNNFNRLSYSCTNV